jgi:hypothetical protein
MRFARLAAALLVTGGLSFALTPASAGVTESASGQGTLDAGMRHFSFNAKRLADGSVTGEAELTNKAFQGVNGVSPYKFHMEVTCMRSYPDNIVVIGGTTKSTNDPNLVDVAFFTVQDNGEPGAGVDKISRVFFWDDDPTTTGDPQACDMTAADAFPLETIQQGNIQVRSA